MTHLALDELLAYWLHETDAAATDAVDEHLMRCDDCGHALDELVALGAGVREAFRAGEVFTMTSPAFLEQLRAAGLRLREYRLAHNGSVNCTIAPEDQLLAAHIEVPLRGVERLDAVAEMSTQPGVTYRFDDLPFDAASGEVIYLPRVTLVRPLPAHTAHLTLFAVAADGTSREVGRYAFHHRPWGTEGP